mgnify:CR=1 FL=1
MESPLSQAIKGAGSPFGSAREMPGARPAGSAPKTILVTDLSGKAIEDAGTGGTYWAFPEE